VTKRFSSLEEVTKHFEDFNSQGTVVLNYTPHFVKSALKDNGDVENAAGMTQEMHNCEDADDDFPLPDEDDEDSRKQLSAFERMRPVMKEIESVFEGASEEQVDKALAMLHLVVAQGQAFRAENQPKTNGTVVSCLPKNKAANKKHKKQLLCKQR
jgi:hypothetical protein